MRQTIFICRIVKCVCITSFYMLWSHSPVLPNRLYECSCTDADQIQHYFPISIFAVPTSSPSFPPAIWFLLIILSFSVLTLTWYQSRIKTTQENYRLITSLLNIDAKIFQQNPSKTNPVARQIMYPPSYIRWGNQHSYKF